jgi:hypothetical protein
MPGRISLLKEYACVLNGYAEMLNTFPCSVTFQNVILKKEDWQTSHRKAGDLLKITPSRLFDFKLSSLLKGG